MMRSSFFKALLAGLTLITFVCVESSAAQGAPFWNPKQDKYPAVKRIQKTYTYRSARAKGNVTIQDPYNYLEKPVTDADVKGFVADQSKLLESYVSKCTNRKSIEQSIRDAFEYDDYTNVDFNTNPAVPFYTYSLKRAGDDRYIWYIATPAEMDAAVKTKFATPPGKKFLDEKFLSANNTATIGSWQTSLDGKYFAYMVADSGSQISTWFVRTFDKPLLSGGPSTPLGGSGTLPDVIPNVDGYFSWRLDSKSFFYTGTLPSAGGSNTDLGSSVRYHVMGTAYEKDITVVKAEPEGADGSNNFWSFITSDDGNWLVVNGADGSLGHGRLYASKITGQTISGNMKWISIAPNQEDIMAPLNVIDDVIYVRTSRGALDGQISKAKLDWSKATQTTNLKSLKDKLPLTTVVPEVRKESLSLAQAFNTDKVVALYTIKGSFAIKIFNLRTGRFIGQPVPQEHPGSLFVMTTANKGTSIKLIMATLTSPRKVYDVQLVGNSIKTTLWLTQSTKGVSAQDFVTETMSATSKDGTIVPYLLISRKGTPKTGTAPVLLHVFGAYAYVEANYYDPILLSWLNSYGGFVAYGSLRGGGDEGEGWHQAGQKHNKQKTFDDAAAVAQDLVKKKIAAPGKVIGHGGSAGAIAITAAANQVQSSFGLLLGVRPVLDYFLRKRSRGGSAQTDEFGDVDDPVDFDYVRAW